jgi:hypothetical protein
MQKRLAGTDEPYHIKRRLAGTDEPYHFAAVNNMSIGCYQETTKQAREELDFCRTIETNGHRRKSALF